MLISPQSCAVTRLRTSEPSFISRIRKSLNWLAKNHQLKIGTWRREFKQKFQKYFFENTAKIFADGFQYRDSTFIKMMFPDRFLMLSKFSRMKTLVHEIAILWRNNSKQNAKASNIYAMFSAQKRHLFILDLTLTFKSKSRISGLLEKYCSKFQYSFGGFKWEMSKSLSYI